MSLTAVILLTGIVFGVKADPLSPVGCGGHRYVLNNDLLTWEEAEQACLNLDTENHRWHLTSIGSGAENDCIVQLINQSRSASELVWIGLKLFNNSQLEWVDGSPVTFTDWQEAEPSSPLQCTLFNSSLDLGRHWTYRQCSEYNQLRSVCKRGNPSGFNENSTTEPRSDFSTFNSRTNSSSDKTKITIGTVIGTVVIVILIIIVCRVCCQRMRRRRARRHSEDSDEITDVCCESTLICCLWFSDCCDCPSCDCNCGDCDCDCDCDFSD